MNITHYLSGRYADSRLVTGLGQKLTLATVGSLAPYAASLVTTWL